MTLTSFLFPLLLLALLAAANPVVVNRSPVTLPLARFINFTGVHNLLQHDQARAQVLKNRAFGRGSAPAAIIDEPATDRLVSYVASVGFGSQATPYSLIIDTGSSNTWLGAEKTYVPSSTSKATDDPVYVSYGSGSMSGLEFYDKVTITPDLVIPQQSIGVADLTNGFDGVDGILGYRFTYLVETCLIHAMQPRPGRFDRRHFDI